MALWWVRSDPCGLFSASFTIVLILFAAYVVISILLLPWYGVTLHIPIYASLTILSMVSHSRAQFSDPGAVPKLAPPTSLANGEPAPPVPRMCRKCKTSKPIKAHHCSSCGRCIIRMDHHCPWVNNCVAIYNQKYFILFLFYTAVACIYSGALLIARFVSCTHNMRQCTVGGVHAALAIICFVEALVFGLFVIIMMFDQFSAIFENTPLVDAMQHKKGAARGRYASLQAVFGEPFSWRWFLPLDLTPQMRLDFEAECQHVREEEYGGQHLPGGSVSLGAPLNPHLVDSVGHHDTLPHQQHLHAHDQDLNPAEPLISDSKTL